MVSILTISAGNKAEASFILNIEQSGSDVVATGSGSINTGGLSFVVNTGGGPSISSGDSGKGYVALGPSPDFSMDLYSATITGPTLGSGSYVSASSGSGDPFNLDLSGGYIGVPTGYMSGNALSDSATWDSTTLSGLGLTLGTYTYTWGSGANTDFLTLNVGPPAPEPGSIFLLGIGGTGLLLICSRNRAIRK